MQKRSLKELIYTEDPAWPLVQEWINAASNTVEVLKTDRAQAEKVLLYLQVTTRSPLGAVAFETGGLLVDHGWLRFLGSGNQRLSGNLLSWNASEPIPESHLLKGAFFVAYDAVGGGVALNGGAFSDKLGTVFYFGPDTLQWHHFGGSYSQLISWALTADLEQFYHKMRWPGWENDVSTLNGDRGISIFPFLCTEKGLPVAERSRRAVPMLELWNLHLDLAQQLKNLPEGTPIQVHFEENPNNHH